MFIKGTSILYIIMLGGLILFAACPQKEQTALTPTDYRSWRKTTNLPLNYPIPGHESNYRVIYINAVGENVQPTQKNTRVFYEYPEGTVIVKEVYEGLGTPAQDALPKQLTVMLKAAQHPQSKGGWLWLVKDVPTGKETMIDYEFCVDCHANANEQHPYGDKNPNNDFRNYVFFPPGQTLPAKAPSASSYDRYKSRY